MWKFLQVSTYERARPPESGLAVDGDATRRGLAYLEEPLQDVVRRGAAVGKEEVLVLKTASDEALGVVDLLVESDDGGDSMKTEVVEVGFRCMERIAVIDARLGVRATKGQEFLRHQPVKVPVLDLW